MNLRLPLLSAALVSLLLPSPASATTTLYKFCADSSDNTTQQDNRLVSTNAGWVINDIGADTKLGDGNYTYAFRMKNSTSVVSPTYTGGMAITKVVVGARVTDTARVYHVTPSVGSEQTKTPTVTGKREELVFSFDSKDNVAYVTITTPSGTGNSYLYDVTITTLKPLSTPTNLDVSGAVGANDFTVEWDSVTGAEGYSVKAIGPNGSVVWTNNVATTSATISGLAPSTQYSVVVVALGDYDTTDDSAAATLSVTTDASSAATPTLVVANTSSWTAGAAGTSAVSAMLEDNVACTVGSVTMSDGSTATVANGTLSWTPPFSATASTVTATFYVTNGGAYWYLSETLSVAATPAPSAPIVSFSGMTAQSFTASWTASAGGPVSSYKVRAWTGRATPDDSTGSATQNFGDYLATTNVPAGWVFENSKKPYTAQPSTPVDFRENGNWIATPDFGGTVTSVSFQLHRNTESGSTFTVYGSSGSADPAVWRTSENTLATYNPISSDDYTLPVDASRGISRLFFQYTKAAGNLSFGTFSVSGTDWPAADFLEGWGGAKVSVGAVTSQTIDNPVAGETNYVEVTAVGPAGAMTTTIASVSVPATPKPAVISVK